MLVLLPIQESLRNAPLLIVLLLAGSGSGKGPLWGLAGLVVAVLVGALRWFTTRYLISSDQVQVRRGLFRRRTLTVLRDRVRTVDLTAHALHRMLGLASVTIGTGRSDRKDDRGLRLDGLSSEAAAWVRQELLHQPAETSSPAGQTLARGENGELARWSPRWIGFGPFSLSGAVTMLAVGGFGLQIVSEGHLQPNRLGPVHGLLQGLGSLSTAALVLAVLVGFAVLTALVSTLGYILAFWNFLLIREAGTLQVSRGLVTNRVVSIDERRLRGVELSEPLLLRWVGGARCIAIATGLRVGRGSERGGSLLVPPAPRAVSEGATEAILGSRTPLGAVLRQHGPTARRRRYSRVVLATGLPLLVVTAALVQGLAPAWPALALLGLLAVGVPLAEDRYRSLGHTVVGGFLVSRSGSLVRRRCMVASEGIIGWNLKQTFFQRRARLVTLVATTPAGRQAYGIQDLSEAEAIRVAEAARPGLLSPFLEFRSAPKTVSVSTDGSPGASALPAAALDPVPEVAVNWGELPKHPAAGGAADGGHLGRSGSEEVGSVVPPVEDAGAEEDRQQARHRDRKEGA
ncbi:MAG TPA: PH domain-containing protein [Candidatus Dormibacteraeota bacterium]|nr:PH domain-containing protein [Candidatus Dormibacteraeota bacterium]